MTFVSIIHVKRAANFICTAKISHMFWFLLIRLLLIQKKMMNDGDYLTYVFQLYFPNGSDKQTMCSKYYLSIRINK